MHVPSAIRHAIDWFCHGVVRLAQSIQQLSAQSALAASPLSLRKKQNRENRLIYKLLKSFFFIFSWLLLVLSENPQSHGCRGPTSSQRASQQLGPRRGPHSHKRTRNKHPDKNGQTGGQSDRESVRAGSHIAAFSLIRSSTGTGEGGGVGCRQRCGDKWLVRSSLSQGNRPDSIVISSHPPTIEFYSKAVFPILGRRCFNVKKTVSLCPNRALQQSALWYFLEGLLLLMLQISQHPSVHSFRWGWRGL